MVAAGLEPDQAIIYELLLKYGPLKAGKIALKSPLKRGLVYKILDELVDLGLVIKNEPTGKVAVFEPVHPLKLKDIAESKEQKLKTAQLALDGIMGQLSSDYNFALGKPGIQIFEGREGILKVANDSLTSKTEIYSYIDNEAVNKFIPDINKEYVKKRDRLDIHKKMITYDSEYIRQRVKSFNPAKTQVRVIDKSVPFATVMQIYDGKVSYFTLDEKRIIGVVIADYHIYQMHKSLFEYTWEKAKPLN
jgi:sugar-specific transcriptional regulator TrmB